MDNFIPIIVGGLIILAVIVNIIDSSQRKNKAEQIGLVKCPKCRGNGWVNDDDDQVRCSVCRKSPVRGYVTQERKNRYQRSQTFGCIIFLIIALIVAYYVLNG